MLPKTTSVTIRGDLEQRVTASGRLGASSVPVTPPPPARKSCVEQWVDDAANWVAPPTPLSRAAYDAVGMALGLEGLVVTTAAALVVATRWQFCRIRYSQWDRELGRVLRR